MTARNSPRPESEQAGRHAEIKRRYSREWPAAARPGRIKSIRRAQVLRLLADRHGGTLPADASGEAALQLLFELGLEAPTAQRLAPWADGADIERLIAAADDNRRDWATRRSGEREKDPKLVPERIGERLEISFGEYRRLHLTHLRPCDVPRHLVDQYLSDRRVGGNRDRMRRVRAGTITAATCEAWDLPDGRAKALACAPLSNREWWSIRELAAFACERLGAFNGLDHAAGRRATLRAVDELERLGIVETKIEAAPRGLKVLYARRLTTAAEIEAENRQLLEEVAAAQNAEIIDCDT